ncbi:MAG: ABC transporter substrate-binding protein [Pseudomonadales bacterium]|nr:ABC transporter substrate-binding protein [Pseudomonadales bacterium]
MKNPLIFILLLLGPVWVFASTPTNKTIVSSCDRTIQFDKPPEKAVSHDINLTEMMFALQLQDNMAGYSGINGKQNLSHEFKVAAGDLVQVSNKDPSLESLLALEVDFFFAGWSYGLRPGGILTPSSLKPFGIEVYELTESCIHVMKKKESSFEDVYNDLSNLGKIFAVEERASILIEGFKETVAQIQVNTQAEKPVSVFVYDSGKDAPFTAGLYAIPNTMIQTAGGRNIVDDLPSSWIRTSWETVVERNPEVIIIVDYGKETADEKIQFLNQHPALSQVSAIVNQRFVVLTYAEATPGIRNFYATQRLAQAFHPDVFPETQLVKRY